MFVSQWSFDLSKLRHRPSAPNGSAAGQRGARLADPDQHEKLLVDLLTLVGSGFDRSPVTNARSTERSSGAQGRSPRSTPAATGTGRLVGVIRA